MAAANPAANASVWVAISAALMSRYSGWPAKSARGNLSISDMNADFQPSGCQATSDAPMPEQTEPKIIPFLPYQRAAAGSPVFFPRSSWAARKAACEWTRAGRNPGKCWAGQAAANPRTPRNCPARRRWRHSAPARPPLSCPRVWASPHPSAERGVGVHLVDSPPNRLRVDARREPERLADPPHGAPHGRAPRRALGGRDRLGVAPQGGAGVVSGFGIVFLLRVMVHADRSRVPGDIDQAVEVVRRLDQPGDLYRDHRERVAHHRIGAVVNDRDHLLRPREIHGRRAVVRPSPLRDRRQFVVEAIREADPIRGLVELRDPNAISRPHRPAGHRRAPPTRCATPGYRR